VASSRQGSRDSANESGPSPSTPVSRTKRPKTGGSFLLDSDQPQDLVRVDSADDPEAEFNRLIGALLSLAPSPQDVGVGLDLCLDDEEAAMMESILVDSDDEIWEH